MGRASSRRYFIPICLYPHTQYRTRAGLLKLFTKFELAKSDHLIVVADHLLALDKIVTGRYWKESMVFQKARKESEGVYRLLKRVAREEKLADRCLILYWNEISKSPEFELFSLRLIDFCKLNSEFMEIIESFVQKRIERFGMGAEPKREREAEFEYIFGEISMSVYCTEILRYSIEIWERPLQPEDIDPLRILYERYPEIILSTCRATGTMRQLQFLSERGGC